MNAVVRERRNVQVAKVASRTAKSTQWRCKRPGIKPRVRPQEVNIRPLHGITACGQGQVNGTTAGGQGQVTGTTAGGQDQVTGTTAGGQGQVTGTTADSQDQVTGTTAGSQDQVTGTTAGSQDQVTGTTAGGQGSLACMVLHHLKEVHAWHAMPNASKTTSDKWRYSLIMQHTAFDANRDTACEQSSPVVNGFATGQAQAARTMGGWPLSMDMQCNALDGTQCPTRQTHEQRAAPRPHRPRLASSTR
jgi:hypothetical protein